jgi:hypothetical protein
MPKRQKFFATKQILQKSQTLLFGSRILPGKQGGSYLRECLVYPINILIALALTSARAENVSASVVTKDHDIDQILLVTLLSRSKEKAYGRSKSKSISDCQRSWGLPAAQKAHAGQHALDWNRPEFSKAWRAHFLSHR